MQLIVTIAQIPVAALNALCAIISDFLLPENNEFPRSWFLFRNTFAEVLGSRWKKVDICINEDHIFLEGQQICPICGEQRYKIKRLKKGDHRVPRKWFYKMSLIDQINYRFSKDVGWVQVLGLTY